MKRKTYDKLLECKQLERSRVTLLIILHSGDVMLRNDILCLPLYMTPLL